MLPSDFDQIDASQIERLVADKVPEDRHLEYKQTINLEKEGDRKEFLADVSSFANAVGGDLIFGIAEERDSAGRSTGLPSAITGLVGFSESDRVKLDSIINGGIAPKLVVRTKLILHPKGSVLVIRIPRSWAGPHMVTLQMRPQFYGRLNASKMPLDVEQIRSAFIESDSIADRLRSLRADRVARIMIGETPWRVTGAAVALHIASYASLSRVYCIDVHAAREDSRLEPMAAHRGWSRHYNAEGAVAISPTDDGNSNYVQVFRNGVLEAVTSDVSIASRTGSNGDMLMPTFVETAVIEQLPRYRDMLLALGLSPPFAILVSVLNVRGMPIAANIEGFRLQRQRKPLLDRNELLLPDVIDETGRERLDPIMRPVFDALWQCGDYARSPNYDADGNWTRPR